MSHHKTDEANAHAAKAQTHIDGFAQSAGTYQSQLLATETAIPRGGLASLNGVLDHNHVLGWSYYKSFTNDGIDSTDDLTDLFLLAAPVAKGLEILYQLGKDGVEAFGKEGLENLAKELNIRVKPSSVETAVGRARLTAKILKEAGERGPTALAIPSDLSAALSEFATDNAYGEGLETASESVSKWVEGRYGELGTVMAQSVGSIISLMK